VFSHAQVFYGRVLGQTASDDDAEWIAGFILARGRETIDERDLYRSYGRFKPQDKRGDIQPAMHALEMLNWVRPIGPGRQGKPNKWEVNPAVHDGRFATFAAAEHVRRSGVREMIAQAGAEHRAA
jgi:hypothetical protein